MPQFRLCEESSAAVAARTLGGLAVLTLLALTLMAEAGHWLTGYRIPA